jgi:hypothetical protein
VSLQASFRSRKRNSYPYLYITYPFEQRNRISWRCTRGILDSELELLRPVVLYKANSGSQTSNFLTLPVHASSRPVIGLFMSVGESVCWPFTARTAGKLLCRATARNLPQYYTQPAKTKAICKWDFISWDGGRVREKIWITDRMLPRQTTNTATLHFRSLWK